LLQVADVTFEYGRTRASPVSPPARRSFSLGGISLTIGRGGFVGILGPNGSGKTTLLKLLGGALRPASGTIRLDGHDVGTLSRRALARRVAVVPQETHLAFDYTALEVVLMGRYPHLGAFAFEGQDDLSAAEAAMETTGTAELAARPFATLSGGEKQRVIIASALAQLDGRGDSRRAASNDSSAGGGALLLLDEPTASLDLKCQIQIAALLRQLNETRQLTVVLSTHDLRLARAVCTRLVLLSAGGVLADGPPAEVLTPARVGQLYDLDPELAVPILS
jgi:iron complex transport system ATP-binding protein